MYREDVVDEFKNKLIGDLRDAIIMLFDPFSTYAKALYDAIIEADAKTIIEISVALNAEQFYNVAQKYKYGELFTILITCEF